MPLIRRYHISIYKSAPCSPKFLPNGSVPFGSLPTGDPPEIEQFLEATPGDLEITDVDGNQKSGGSSPSWGKGSWNVMIYRHSVSKTSEKVVVWDFWTINSSHLKESSTPWNRKFPTCKFHHFFDLSLKLRRNLRGQNLPHQMHLNATPNIK